MIFKISCYRIEVCVQHAAKYRRWGGGGEVRSIRAANKSSSVISPYPHLSPLPQCGIHPWTKGPFGELWNLSAYAKGPGSGLTHPHIGEQAHTSWSWL